MDSDGSQQGYAHLPEDLIKQMLEAIPSSVKKMNSLLFANEEAIEETTEKIRQKGLILKLGETEVTDSVIAVDGGNVMERLSGCDLLLAVAVGVEGLRKGASSGGWREDKNQYYQWQHVMAHDEATPRLLQGVMFLMELSVLANADYRIKVMDGMHFTPILKINSMLSAREESAGAEYVDALRRFLDETYKRIIPDIPDMVAGAFSDDTVVAMAKYSSSRDLLDSVFSPNPVALDDKTFFTLGLEADEYTQPLSVGQSKEERRKIWNDLHISCNLNIDEKEELNEELKKVIAPICTRKGEISQDSNIYFTYFKPYLDGPAYRIECKKSLADDSNSFQTMLASIKHQIVYPDILEPFPQYLADLMAKSVSGGLYAMQDAIRMSKKLDIDSGRLALLFPYRSS